MAETQRSIRWRDIVFLGIILAVATVLRTWRLSSVPPGLTHDEANNVCDAASVLKGERPLYFPVAQGKEPLYPYSVALVMTVLGPTALAMRLTSVSWGILLVVLTYIWTRRSFGRLVALWTATGLAISFWSVSTSRLGLRAIALPVLLSGVVLAYPFFEPRRPSVACSVIAGLCLGLTFYTYLAARVVPVLFLLFGGYLMLVQPERFRAHWSRWLIVFIVAASVAAPLFLYLWAHPSASIRMDQLNSPLRSLLGGNPVPLFRKVVTSVQIFSFQGDGFVPYNIPGRPLFNPLLSVFFYGGIIIALWRWRDPAHAFALLWLLAGFFPALATGLDAANLRAIVAQPISFVFPALALKELWNLSSRWSKNVHLVLVGIVASGVFASVAFLTVRDYFVRWPSRQDVRVHYHTNLKAMADVARGWRVDEPVGISTFYPGQYHDPRIVRALMTGGGPSLRWFDGRQALVLPSSSSAKLVLPAAIPLDDALWNIVRPETDLLERVTLQPDDFNPSFAVYRWAPMATRDALAKMVTPPSGPEKDSVSVGGVLNFRGYQLQGWTGEGGTEFSLLTLWDVDAYLPDERDAVLFAQLLDSQSQVVAQQDRLGAPSWNWHPGDVFVQLHRLSLPADVPPGSYVLILGAYTTPDRVDAVLAGQEPDPSMPRLTVREGEEPWGDAITLLTLEVE